MATSSAIYRTVERVDSEMNVVTGSADVTSTRICGTVVSERARMAVYDGLLLDYHTFATPTSNVSLGGGCDGGSDAILRTHYYYAECIDHLSSPHVLTCVVARCLPAFHIKKLSSSASGRPG